MTHGGLLTWAGRLRRLEGCFARVEQPAGLPKCAEPVGAVHHNPGMTFREWSEPVRLMEQRLGPVTEDQQALAADVGLALPSELPAA